MYRKTYFFKISKYLSSISKVILIFIIIFIVDFNILRLLFLKIGNNKTDIINYLVRYRFYVKTLSYY